MGNGVRSVRCLHALAEAGRVPVLVVGHAGVEGPGSLQAEARGRGLPVMAPEDPNGDAFVAAVRDLEVDLGVLAGYTPILKPGLLEAPRLGFINLHGGKLPEYRGAAPINWQIINGETRAGLAVIKVDVGIDTGDILEEREYAIGPDDRYDEIVDKTLGLFPAMLNEVMARYEAGRTEGRPQDPDQGAYWCRRYPEDGLVDFRNMRARQVHDLVRALAPPMPGAFAFHQGRRVILHRTRLMERIVKGRAGRVVLRRPEGVVVMARDRGLLLTEIRLPGQEGIVKARDFFADTRELFDVREG